MIVGMIAQRMAGRDDLFQPVDIFLLEHLAHHESVQHPAMGFDAAAGLDGVGLRLVVEIPLFEIPVRVVPVGKIGAHLQVERDRYLGFLRRCDSGSRLIGC